MSVMESTTTFETELRPVTAPLLVSLLVPGEEPIEIEVSQKALDKVLADFNPSADQRVRITKGLHAAMIQVMLDHVQELMADPDDDLLTEAAMDAVDARLDLATRAVDQLEITQMLAVKSFFAKA